MRAKMLKVEQVLLTANPSPEHAFCFASLLIDCVLQERKVLVPTIRKEFADRISNLE